MPTSMASVYTNLKAHFEAEGDGDSSARIDDLLKRIENSTELYVSLSGHFSAGKSSLINALIGESLLPSSPIPTSANLVFIRYGKSRKAKLNYRNGQQQDVELEELDAACKNGEEIKSVEILVPSPLLKKGLCLLDTPGVDSTDPAHAEATFAAIHLADVVLFVTDYNHVQSESNYVFLKQLEEWQKQCIFIINQIDKHRQQEISFIQFDRQVRQSLQEWELNPLAQFYISVKDREALNNQIEILKNALDLLGENSNKISSYTLTRSVSGVVMQHFQEKREMLKSTLQQLLQNEDDQQLEQWVKEREGVVQRIDQLEQKTQRWLQEKKKEVGQLLDNANIIPAITREKIHDFIESRHPQFKVGWLLGKRKTEKEQERRIHVLMQDLREQIEVHIVKHLHPLLELSHLSEDEKTDLLKVEIEEELLLGMLEKGASATNEYTMNFAHRVSDQVKRLYRKGSFQALEQEATEKEKEAAVEISHEKEKLQRLEQKLKVIDQYEENVQRLRQEEERLLQSLPLSLENPLQELFHHAQSDVILSDEGETQDQDTAKLSQEVENQLHHKKVDDHTMLRGYPMIQDTAFIKKQEETKQWSSRFTTIASSVEAIPGFDHWKAELLEKAHRLNEHAYTVALFGAFSAGKSSFANALLGQEVLPVSPSPTTASVIRIMKVPEGAEQRTAHIMFKTEQQLEKEVLHSIDTLGLQADNLQEALQGLQDISYDSIPAKAKLHFTFLESVREGFDQIQQKLGTKQFVSYDEYVVFAAKESVSCFVDSIDFYIDCPLTLSGIVLVDTPGADSIHARHTGVAFHYMRHADAVLFVTYYNHAFSRADRDFLTQLSQVSRLSEMDHLFFILNAADLAGSSEELDEVYQYVKGQLQQCEILNPRLFPVSSRDALKGKQTGDLHKLDECGIIAFEQQFYPFILHELPYISIEAGKQDLIKLQQYLKVYKEQLRGDKQAKVKEIEEVRKLQEEWEQNEQWKSRVQTSIYQEVNEHVYYVKQRAMYRYHDSYASSFHPSILHQQTKDVKQALLLCWRDLLREILTYTMRELQTLEARMEKWLKDLGEQEKENWLKISHRMLDSYAYPPDFILTLTGNDLSFDLQGDEVEAKWLLSQYKNPKSFFEGTGKDKLKTALEPYIEQELQQQLDIVSRQLAAQLVSDFESSFEQWKKTWYQQWHQVMDGMIHTMESENLHDKIQRVQADIDHWI